MNTLLPFFGAVRVSGADRAVFLHNQLSNDVLHLDTAHAAYATYNTPRGRVIADMLVLPHAEDICLIMAADLCESVIKRLRMFVLRSQVSLDLDETLGVAAALDHHAVSDFTLLEQPPLQLPRSDKDDISYITLPHGGVMMIGARTQLPAYDAAAEAAWQRHEIGCGFAHISAATSEACVAQMLNQHLLGGVHFNKGCYPGQEIIARAQYRGQVRRGLAVYRTDTPLAAGVKILDENKEDVGIVLNSAPDAAGGINLCVIKHDAADKVVSAAARPLGLKKLFFAK